MSQASSSKAAEVVIAQFQLLDKGVRMVTSGTRPHGPHRTLTTESNSVIRKRRFIRCRSIKAVPTL